MRTDSKTLEASRMTGLSVEDYPWLHERHRVFPEIFESREHRKILDTSAGIGIIAKKLSELDSFDITCNEIDETCISQLKKLNVDLLSFDLDTETPYPVDDSSYDAVISLATLEHLINIDHYMRELKRILKDSGRLYISVPNYASLYWMIPLLKGKTFHDPFGERSRYEFYAHIRYFTYHTLLDYVSHFGFSIDTVYCPLPQGSTKFKEIKEKNSYLAQSIRSFFYLLYLFSPRWHQEPILCFAKNESRNNHRVRKVIL
jgi:SAM-dependent methyltransferase